MARKRQNKGTLSGRFAARAARKQTGFSAGGTANMLTQMDPNFAVMLEADACDGLSDQEVRVIKAARRDLRNAIKRLRAIEKRCKATDV